MPTAISREEEREEEKEEKEEVKEVPDTLLLSISPDLVGFLSHAIPVFCGPCQFLDGPSYDRERTGQKYGINFRQHFFP